MTRNGRKGRTWPAFVFVVIVIATVLVMNYLLGLTDKAVDGTSSWLSDVFTDLATAKSVIPKNDTPPSVPVPSVREIWRTAHIYQQPFVVNPHVFDDKSIFKSQVRQLLLKGSFKKAELHISGAVTASGPHFLYLVYGNDSGIINGYRYSANQLDVDQTLRNGGVFTSDAPIDLTVDLMSNRQFATSNHEYLATGKVTKPLNLWKDNLSPPTVVRVLIAPLDKSGYFQGAKINADFLYQCGPGPACDAYMCAQQYDTAVSCITADKELGPPVAADWCKRSVACDAKVNSVVKE